LNIDIKWNGITPKESGSKAERFDTRVIRCGLIFGRPQNENESREEETTTLAN
jgi:hypothetical protein